MRIVLCNAIYRTPSAPQIVGGAEVFVRQLAEGLVAAGDEVTVIRTALDGRERREEVNDVIVHFLPVRNLFPPFQDKHNPLMRTSWHVIDDHGRAPSGLKAILEAVKPDVFHSHALNGLSADCWRVAKNLSIPVVHTLHDYYLGCPRCSRFKNDATCETTCAPCRALTTGRRQRTRWVDVVTSVSRRTLDIHQADGIFAGDDRAVVVSHVADERASILPLPPSAKPLSLGYIGRFAVEKGIDLLVESVGRLPANLVRLTLAGHSTPEEQARLRALAPNADLEFLGFVTPEDFYRRVHVTVTPSLWEEPAGLVILDAIAYGRPVVGTRRGGIPEAIEDGVTGWIVEPTVESLTTRLRLLAEDPAQVMEAAATLAERAPDRRGFAALTQDYRAIYRNLGARDQA